MEPSKGISIVLSPMAVYKPKELVVQRRYKGHYDEYLVRWSRLETTKTPNVRDSSQKDEDRDKREKTCAEYVIWMRRAEMEVCCPHLLSLDSTPVSPTPPTTTTVPAAAAAAAARPSVTRIASPFPQEGVPEGEDSLHEMMEDIKNLVVRAQKLHSKSKPGSGLSGRMLSNTISILSAYAKIGALANSFRESGALDLLLSLLSSQDLDVRRSASDMLRSLATHDLASRSYVLLQLTRSDDKDPTAKITVQSRRMLLDLFSETASMDESELLLSGVTLPQVPGRFIFSLLKKYLRVTSLTCNDSAATPLPHGGNSPAGLDSNEPNEFELFYTIHQLVSELFSIFSWFEGGSSSEQRTFKGVSIFTGTTPREELPQTSKKKKKNPYKIRDAFTSDREYGQYVKNTLKPDMKVRARVNYESISEGDFGVYRQTNDGTPPAQFAWDGLGGDTYWLFWHQVEILPPSNEKETAADAALNAFQQNIKTQPYVMKSLALPGGGSHQKSHEMVNRPFWWEVLCLVKPLSAEHLPSVMACFNNPQLKTFEDLINMSPTYGQVAEVVQCLETACPHLSQEPLSIKEMSLFREAYQDPNSGIAPVKDELGDDSSLEGPYKREPPYSDPYDKEEPIRSSLSRDLPNLDDAPLGLLRTLSGLLRHRKEDMNPSLHLRSLERSQDGSLSQLTSARETVDKYSEKYPTSIRVAVSSFKALKAGLGVIASDSVRQECCVTGFFGLFLKLMKVDLKSCTLQCIGLECFFHLLGGFGFDPSLPVPPNETRSEAVSGASKSLIMATLASLATAPECGMQTVAEAVACVVENYNLSMNTATRKNCVLAVRSALHVLAALVGSEVKMDDWGLPQLMEAIQHSFPDFATKSVLCGRIVDHLPGHVPPSLLAQGAEPTPEAVKALTQEVMAVLKTLMRLEDIHSKNPLPRLLRLMERDSSLEPFHRPSALLATVLLVNNGIYYLTQAMETNRSTTFAENALCVIGSVVDVGEEEAARVVLQGGLKATISCMNTYPSNKPIQRMCLTIFHRLSRDPDHLVIMAAENVIPPLRNAKEKYSTDADIVQIISEMVELCESEETSRAALHHKILSIIFSGVLQTILTAIEDARRERQLVNLPRFSAIIRHLSSWSGGSVSVGEVDQWWERMEVSSCAHRKDRIIDGDPSTFWESSGRAGTHWVRIHMRKGLVIRKMYMEVSSADSSYMPQRVTIQGGPTADNVQDISTVYIPSTFNGPFEILANLKKFFAVIIIRIKRCQQGGIDSRVRSMSCHASRSSLWPLFGDFFSARTKLFYRIQVQTWLKDSNIGALEIFDRLSAVVLHEQTFADNFLVTAQSRQCLGQACRSSLLTPLIDTLTQRSSGSTDLEALIHDYITQMQPPLASKWKALTLVGGGGGGGGVTGGGVVGDGSCSFFGVRAPDFSSAQLRLVQMSRIRRMCRLLVDCDTNPVTQKKKFDGDKETDEGAAAGKDPGNGGDSSIVAHGRAPPPQMPGTGTMAIAKCWRDIVQHEVDAVLLRVESHCEPPLSLAADVLGIYDQLKQAMLELFGGHSQFALALKEGFSNAFQRLDEVSGVRFCELLCLCIDSLMDGGGRDSPRFQHLGEHQRETMLLHFAEPLQFLHNLDIAHIFEHYYRRHLSARLLRGRSVSLPLERRLSKAFAHCFPHKYPLQMLQDLDDSGTLMDRFCDSELLECLDQLLVQASEPQQGHTPPDLPPEILDLAQRCSSYRQRCLQVYMLNPCFWPLRQRPMSPGWLPEHLLTFCQDYTHFFSAVHEYGLHQYERARKLHWTLYGWATIAHCGLKLMTSTVQMIVLLQFNTFESHSLRSLQEATQLPYAELTDALLALTAERQCVLIATPLTASAPDVAAPVAMAAEEEQLHNSPFKLNTVFRVNANFAKEVSLKQAQKSHKVRIHDVRLISRGHPGSVGGGGAGEHRGADLLHIFERRRAIIDSAIVRILKREKEMSMDNMASKVTKGCSAGKFDRGALFGRFECDFRDVCSRVDRLVLDGYVKRDDANQQMLFYVPDPTTSGGGPEGEGEAGEEEEEEETVASEDAAIATNTTSSVVVVGEPDKATPTSPAPTTKPPLTRKRPGARSSGSGKTKRKAQGLLLVAARSSHSSFGGDERDDAPLLGMLPSLRSLTTTEVKAQICSQVNSMSQVLKAEPSVVEHLLHHCLWNKDTVVARYLRHSSALLEEAGLSGKCVAASSPSSLPSSSSSSSSEDAISCPVCLLTTVMSDALWLWCGHACCRSCWQNHLLAQIDLNQALSCSCPTMGCRARPTRDFFTSIFGADTEPVEKFSKAMVRSYVQQNGRLTWCHNPQGCDLVLCRGDGISTGSCHRCHWTSCFSCSFIEAHEPASCSNMQKWVESGGFYEGMDEDAKSKQLASVIAKKCPGCNAPIEKNEGCLHMKCKCGHGFCWKCLKPWRPTHTDYYNCTAKVSKAAQDHRKFTDYNDRCAAHHKSKGFAERLCLMVKAINESVSIKTLSFLSDACQLLGVSHKMLSYACVAEFFSQPDSPAYLTFLAENLEGDTNALQVFLENTLIAVPDVAQTIRSLSDRRLMDGYRLVSKIENTRDKILLGFHQQFKLGDALAFNPLEEAEGGEEEEEEERTKRRFSPMDDEDDDDIGSDLDDDLSYIYSDYEDSLHGLDSDDDYFHYDSDTLPFFT